LVLGRERPKCARGQYLDGIFDGLFSRPSKSQKPAKPAVNVVPQTKAMSVSPYAGMGTFARGPDEKMQVKITTPKRPSKTHLLITKKNLTADQYQIDLPLAPAQNHAADFMLSNLLLDGVGVFPIGYDFPWLHPILS
jgi:hypothetical protein